MHAALTVYELLSMIFQHVPDNSRVEDFLAPDRPKRQLLWIALTCKTFTRPALDVMWRDLTFMPALWPFVPLARQAQLLTYNGNATAQDWYCFEKYAKCVRIIRGDVCANWFPNFTIDQSLFQQIVTSRGTLFPGLQALDIEINGLVPNFLLLKSNTLHTIRLNVETANEQMTHWFLMLLPHFFPFLRRLYIVGSLKNPAYPSALGRQMQLCTLDLSEVTDMDALGLLNAVSTLAHLHSLIMPPDSDVPLNVDRLVGTFPSLKEIDLANTMEQNLHILTLLPMAALTHIKIERMLTVDDSESDDEDEEEDEIDKTATLVSEWQELFENLERCANLEFLEIADVSSRFPQEIDLMSFLKPLVKSVNLRCLVLNPFVPIVALPDSIVMAITSAFPNVECLFFPRIITSKLIPTFASLQHIARNCPRLQSLGLSVDVSTQTLPTELGSANGALLHFHPGLSSLIEDTSESAVLVANHLTSIFPRLGLGMLDQEEWFGVQEMVGIAKDDSPDTWYTPPLDIADAMDLEED